MKNLSLKRKIQDQTFVFDKDRVIYWEEKSILFLSDLHIGKVAHFRSNGRPLPNGNLEEILSRFDDVLFRYNPKEVIILGDLFHYKKNVEVKKFSDWLRGKDQVIKLVLGNHDKFSKKIYIELGIDLIGTNKLVGDIELVHRYEDKKTDNLSLSGHIHPEFKLDSNDRLAAFVFKDRNITLPAFNKFTGTTRFKYDDLILMSEEEIFSLDHQDKN